MPNDRDILYSKREYGITVETVYLGELGYRFVKPPPEMSNRSRIKKQLAMFDDVDIVVFEVDLSLYDEILLDLDNGQMVHTPGLHMALREFGNMCSSIQSKDIILVLDKYTLFQEKIQTKPLQAYHPDYAGGSDHAIVTDYLRSLFVSKKGYNERNLYGYIVGEHNKDINCFRAMVNCVLIERNLEARDLLQGCSSRW